MTNEQLAKGHKLMTAITEVETVLTQIKTARISEVETNHGGKINVDYAFRDEVTKALAKCYNRKLKELQAEFSTL